ncbi:hypothetical protein [Caballeronia sp. 15711]|uniref:hypothetical protein n=1 Tax=Caballeronia sp. 15711 TaxID=3391029 RepID=UPI0039E52AA0
MKLVRVKVEYSCGLTLLERASLEVGTGEVHLPPRLIGLMAKMRDTEVFPIVSVEHNGHVLSAIVSETGTAVATIPEKSGSGMRRLLHAITFPTKDQRQQNGRFLHTLAAASIGGAVGYSHSAASWDLQTIIGTANVAGLGVLLWYAGFEAMKGD